MYGDLHLIGCLVSLPGPPLSQDSALTVLLAANVTVGIGIPGPSTAGMSSTARNARFDLAWVCHLHFDYIWLLTLYQAAIEADGALSKADALALASVNLEGLLGIDAEIGDLVVTKGGSIFDFEAKVIGIVSPQRGVVDLI